MNTTAVVFATKAMNHVEGGWPKEVDYTEAEHVIRYRKKVTMQHDSVEASIDLRQSGHVCFQSDP